MYLGPLFTAQQVLDPSLQTGSPRKERKGGPRQLQPSLQKSKPRVVRYGSPTENIL